MTKKKHAEMNDEKEIQASENKNNAQHTEGNGEKQEGMPSDINETAQVKEKDAASAEAGDKLVAGEKSADEKLAEMQDKYLRLSAEFDNYRKRTLKEKMDISRYAGEELLRNLLPLADDFERALKHIEAAADIKGVREGIDLIYVKFTEFLKHHGIKEIDSLNADFNVDLHDAVAKIPAPEENKKGKVVEVIQKGYYLKDKILRHSKVVVGE